MKFNELKMAEKPENRFFNTRLVHLNSSYSNGFGPSAEGSDTIVIIDLYECRRFAYQDFTRLFNNGLKKENVRVKNISREGEWSLVVEPGNSIQLCLSFDDGNEKSYTLKLSADSEILLDQKKFVLMSLGKSILNG